MARRGISRPTVHARSVCQWWWKTVQVPAPRINDIVRERRAVSADTAMRLARFFNMSPEFWMGLQADDEMALAATTSRKN
jgi:addiction module HigA family antidote